MAVVVVAAHNTRVAVATIATDTGTWGNDGGGGGVSDEPDIVYQGDTAQSRKVSTTLIGRSYTHGSGTDMTATGRSHCLLKIQATNPAALEPRTTPGMVVKIGSSSANYHQYYLFGNDNYPTRGGWQIVPVSVQVSGYRAGLDVGTPSDTAVLYWSLLGDFTATSKSENLVIDAIDIGAGLNLTAGDGVSADGVFLDFLNFDEDTSGNRFGYCYAEGPILLANGRWAIGQNTSNTSILTNFTDTTAGTAVWGNGLSNTGYHRLLLDIATTSSTVSIDGWTFISTGQLNNNADRGYTTTEDTRLVLEVVGTAGSVTLSNCVFQNLSNVILTSACVLDGCQIECADLTQATADIEGGSKIITNSASAVAVCNDTTFGTTTGLNNIEFEQGPDGLGHAVEITSGSSITMTKITWTGYGANGSNAAAVYNNTGGALTINWSGGTVPTYRNGSGSTTSLVNSLTLTLAMVDEGGAAVTGAEITITDTAATPNVLFHVETSATGTENYAYDGADAGNSIIILVIKSVTDPREPFSLNTTLPAATTTFTLQLNTDRIEFNP